MILVGRDVHVVPWLHLDHAILELQPCHTFQQDDPLVQRLVIPEPFGRGVAVGDNSLDTHVGSGQDRLNNLLGQLLRQFIEYVLDGVLGLFTA